MAGFPPLHNVQFGGADPKTGKEWVGKFVFLPISSTWHFAFLDENEQPVSELTGHGKSPRDAFEDTVAMWIYLNQGEESEFMKQLLPQLRQFFNSEGGVKLGYF